MTDSTPRRRLSPAVYRRRRLVLLLVVIAVIAAVVLAVWRPWEGANAGRPSPSASQPSTPSAPVAGTPSTEVQPDPAAQTDGEPDDAATPPASDVEPCSAASTQVAAMTDKESYGAGEVPQLSISLTNTGETACLLNVGTATQKFTITSGSDTWWRSTDCQSESSDQVVQIDPGQSVSSVTPIAWDRTRSAVDTCGSERPSAPAGYFNLAVEIGGLAAHQDRQFVLR